MVDDDFMAAVFADRTSAEQWKRCGTRPYMKPRLEMHWRCLPLRNWAVKILLFFSCLTIDEVKVLDEKTPIWWRTAINAVQGFKRCSRYLRSESQNSPCLRCDRHRSQGLLFWKKSDLSVFFRSRGFAFDLKNIKYGDCTLKNKVWLLLRYLTEITHAVLLQMNKSSAALPETEW